MMVELHPRRCACHGGSWISLAGQSGAPCSIDGTLPRGALVVPLEQWRAMGKPHNVEEFYAFLSSLSAKPTGAERRAHQRFPVVVGIRLSRAGRLNEGDWPGEESDHAATENVSRGGALVRSRLSAAKGDVLLFEEARSSFRTRARVQDVSGDASDRRYHLRFLDASAPEGLLSV
jgi:hypothetical protein